MTQAAGIAGAAHGAWNRDGIIVFGTNTTALRRVSANGGTPVPVTNLDAAHGEIAHRWVQFLPDGKHFLYHRSSTKPEYAGIYVGSTDLKPEKQSEKPLMLSARVSTPRFRAGLQDTCYSCAILHSSPIRSIPSAWS